MERQTTFDRVLVVIGTVVAVAGLLSGGLVISDVGASSLCGSLVAPLLWAPAMVVYCLGALLPLVVRARSRTAVSPRAKMAVVIGAIALSLPLAVIALIPSPTTYRSCIS